MQQNKITTDTNVHTHISGMVNKQ